MTKNIKDSFNVSDSELDSILAGIPSEDSPADLAEDFDVETEAEQFEEKTIENSKENPELEEAQLSEDNPYEEGDEVSEVEDIEPEFYKETFDKIFAPFKASGKEIQVKSTDEVIKLMQMGADYYNKTQKHAQDIKLATILKTNGLDNTEKLSFLIDVMNNEKGAVKKFLTQINYDEYSYSEDGSDEYTPKDHNIPDSEIQLRNILSEGRDDPTFQELLKEVTEWDSNSRATFSSHPEILNILADNYRTGAYQKIMAEVERKRMFGDFSGLSTLQAYRQVVDSFAASETKNTHKTSDTPQPSKATSTMQDKRKALSPSPRGKVSNASKDIDLYSMSDDEIMKLAL